MHSVNLDLLHAGAAHHPDGRPKDPHAHHRAEHLAARRTARWHWWRKMVGSLGPVLRNESRSLAKVELQIPARSQQI